MLRFRIGENYIRKAEVCEIWVGEKMVATIYPGEVEGTMRIMSKHLATPPLLTGDGTNGRDLFVAEFKFKVLRG